MKREKYSSCFFIVVLCLLVIIYSDNAQAQWVKSSGAVSSKSVWSVAVSGNNVFAATSSDGVHLSTDGGDNFIKSSTGLPNNFISSIVASGTNIFAGTYGDGVFTSIDNGSSWSDANSNGSDTTAVMAFTVSGNNIFAGTDADGIYIATNGSNWTPVNNGIGTKSIRALTVLGTDIFSGTSNSGVFITSDNGTNWNESNTGLPSSAAINCLAVSGTNIYAGTGAGTSDNIVFRSSDNGASWVEASSGLSSSTTIKSLAAKGSNIFAGTAGDGVFLSTNNGASWNEVNDGFTSFTFVFSLTVSDLYLFAGTTSGVWKRPLSEITDVEENFDGFLSDYNLEQNYPNPFNPSTKIKYQIPQSGIVLLKIYDILGKEVATLVNEEKPVGKYEIGLNGENLSGGVYFYQINAGHYFKTKKMILLK